MIIRLLSSQIPRAWEAIKLCVKEADEVDDRDLGPYLNELLQALESDKAQCWVRMDDKRTLIALFVTRINADRLSGTKTLVIQCAYSWQMTNVGIWQEDADIVKQFAKQEGISKIEFSSRNKAVQRVGLQSGFVEKTRVYEMRL
jgi:hypothetical protein